MAETLNSSSAGRLGSSDGLSVDVPRLQVPRHELGAMCRRRACCCNSFLLEQAQGC